MLIYKTMINCIGTKNLLYWDFENKAQVDPSHSSAPVARSLRKALICFSGSGHNWAPLWSASTRLSTAWDTIRRNWRSVCCSGLWSHLKSWRVVATGHTTSMLLWVDTAAELRAAVVSRRSSRETFHVWEQRVHWELSLGTNDETARVYE